MTTTHDDELAKAFLAWIDEGRDTEHVYGVTNFLSSKHFNKYVKARELAAQQNGVAWTVAVIDDLHMKDHSHFYGPDVIYKGIKNAIRDRYRFVTGSDPAPDYPVNVTLKSQQQENEDVR